MAQSDQTIRLSIEKRKEWNSMQKERTQIQISRDMIPDPSLLIYRIFSSCTSAKTLHKAWFGVATLLSATNPIQPPTCSLFSFFGIIERGKTAWIESLDVHTQRTFASIGARVRENLEIRWELPTLLFNRVILQTRAPIERMTNSAECIRLIGTFSQFRECSKKSTLFIKYKSYIVSK